MMLIKNGTPLIRKDIPAFFVCVSGVLFPFSVAATNLALSAVLVFVLLSGSWWRGVEVLWHGYRRLSLAIMMYLFLVVLGLVWSIDRIWGIHILGRHWLWLLLPAGLILFNDCTWRRRFFFALSLGLTVHLGYCVLQKYGLVATTTDGSYAADATGHIGHIGFGFVYGLWAAWLAHWGWLQTGWRRYASWALVVWAWIMVFLAMGRSGYLVTIISFALVAWMHLIHGRGMRTAYLAVLAVAVCSLLLFGSSRSSLERTWNGLQQLYKGNMEEAIQIEERYGLWLVGMKIWQSHSLLGVGTGGYPEASERISGQHPGWIHLGRYRHAHPFNIYLLALCRWGIPGLFLLLWLLFEWCRIGWRVDWRKYEIIPVVPLSGIALAVHGLTSSSIEEHFSVIFAILLLSAGLAELAGRKPEAVAKQSIFHGGGS